MPPRVVDNAGNLIFASFCRPNDSQIQVTDARLIGQLKSRYISAHTKGVDTLANKSDRLVISTPNADYLPQIHLEKQVITICDDGRWGAEDWAQWPQWYFDGQEHLAYILRKPKPSHLYSHPLRQLWLDIGSCHFDPNSEGGGDDDGRLNPTIAEQFYELRTKFMEEVESCECSNGSDHQKLQIAAAQMRGCVAALKFGSSSYFTMKLNVTWAQRCFLEVRALLDKITKFDHMVPNHEGYPEANNELMGCITDRVQVAHEMYEKGVPVWLVRRPSQVSDDATIIDQAYPKEPVQAGIVVKRMTGAPVFYSGPLSGNMYLGIYKWKPGQADMTPVADENSVTSTQETGQAHLPHSVQSVLVPSSTASTSTSYVQTTARPQNTSGLQKNSTGKYGQRAQPYSKAQAIERVAMKVTDNSINLAPFQPPTSAYSSKPSDSWANALKKVDVRRRPIEHPRRSIFKGYAFPSSYILCGDENKSMENVLAWLLIRTRWLSHMGDFRPRTVPLPHIHQWRSYLRDIMLELELLRPHTRQRFTPTEGHGKVSRTARRNAKSREIAKTIFCIRTPEKADVETISWNGRVVWHQGKIDFDLRDRQLVAWDVQQHNFNLELFNLDRCVLVDDWRTTDGALLRENKLRSVFVHESLFTVDLPQHPYGLSSGDWEERRPYISALRNVVVDWPNAPQSLFTTDVNNQGPWAKVNVERVESLVADFYCQTFFDYFGRAACVPHLFP